MKVKPAERVAGTSGPAGQPFKKLLDEARGGAPLKKALPTAKVAGRPSAKSAALPHPALSTAQARVRVHAEAHRLTEVRAAHEVTAREATQHRGSATERDREEIHERVVELICKDLMVDPPAPMRGGPGQPAPTPPPVANSAKAEGGAEPTSRAQQAVALIEKIEVFVKSARPALALTLNNSLGAQVEIERLGPREVALKLISHRGPPSPETLSRLREELGARGLRVAALSVA